MNYSESNESGGGMREPLLDRGRAGEDEDQDIEGLMQNVVGYEYRTGAGDSSTSNSSHSSPSRSYANGDCEIKEQIRGMKKNSLVRISASVPEENGDYARHSPFSERNSAGQVSLQSPNVPRFSRQTSGAGGAAQRKARRSSSIAFKSIESFKSVISKGKSRGTVALLSFHVVLTAVWATLGACFYCWRLKWSFPAAIYFMFQAGYGVGFGGPLVLRPHDDSTKIEVDVLYFTTIVVCLIGSLSVFAFYAFFFHEFQLHAFQSSLDKESRKSFECEVNRKKKVAAYVSRSFHWFCGGWLNDLCGLSLPPVAYAGLAMLLVLALGVGIGIGVEGMNFHEALYFTVSAVQTSGLSAPKENTRSLILCTLLVVLGVPTYAAFCSLLLERIVRPYTKRLQKKIMRHRLASHDNFLLDSIRNHKFNPPSLHINSDDRNLFSENRESGVSRDSARTKEGLNWTEYLEVELMRLGILELETLQSVWENFCIQSTLAQQA